MRAVILGLVGALAWAGAAMADPVTLKANPTDDDGQITLGDVFDGAGAASGVVVGRRSGPSAVFEAGQLQAQAARAGLIWSNPTGLRRVVVRNAAMAPSPSPAPAAPEAAEAARPVVARVSAAPARAAATERVISRNDMVLVAYEADGVRLAITGRAQGNAAVGQPIAVLNLQSRRMIDAVAVGPGQAVAGPAAQAARLDAAQQFAAR